MLKIIMCFKMWMNVHKILIAVLRHVATNNNGSFLGSCEIGYILADDALGCDGE